ncbi:hypothetical protein LCGC14_0302320 [marine sediment metagenome]|uniref:Pilus assembly protein n=1 Tax=marine sediment metagenome TaxID=412755 RepID=A0A0F9WVY2_9ZZZZ|nr:pilus assembly protein [Phycisphaerae bacterium]HDZ45150.1 pilus assembly protein [Phycisphaerae bacterium]
MSDKRHRQPGRRRWVLAAGLIAAVGAGALAAAATWRPADWVAAAAGSRGFLTHAAVVVVAGALLAGALTVLAQAGAPARRGRANRPSDQAGTAILEFAMVLPIALFLVLLMAQSTMLMIGHLSVHYAAFCAARSAVVTVPLDLEDYYGEPRNEVIDDSASSEKIQIIRDAAIWAVLPISSSSRDLADGDAFELTTGLREMFDHYAKDTPAWVDRVLARKLRYADEQTDVWMRRPANDYDFGENEELRVFVRHTFHLSIPYANSFWYRFYALMGRDDVTKLDFGASEYGMELIASCRLTNEGVRDEIIPEEYPVK